MVAVGVDYYPEHWGKEQWDQDIALMARTGVKAVRIAEFAWSRLEPREGEFDFAWLDDVVDRLSGNGLKIILCTPTNSAPVWLYRRYGETLQVERTGRRADTGIRGHRCLSSPVFRRFAGRIVGLLAERYGRRPALIGWQIDNELEANHCNCPHCAAGFRAFLREKYGEIGALNRAWGNDVWSGDFADFEEINTPLGDKYDYGWLNPSYMLDYERFASRSTAGFIRFQRDIIRKYSPGKPVTTNACFSARTPDYYRIFGDLDVAAYDNYPSLYKQGERSNPQQAFVLDLVRGYKRSNFWILEQMSGSFGCWAPISPAPRPGMIAGYAMQAVARGANLVMHFRWRTAARGAEMFCHGLLDHSGVPGRRFREFAEFCAQINALNIPEDAALKSKVALLYSYEQEHAFKIQKMSEGFTYRRQAELLHRAYMSLGVNVDVIEETAGLSGYAVVLVPAHFVADDAVVRKLERFVRSGGTVVVTARSGVKDPYNACLTRELPGPFAKLCGVLVDEYDPIGAGSAALSTPEGKKYAATCWCDILTPQTAEVWAAYDSEFYKGRAAAVRNRFGKGRAYYLGTVGDDALYRDLAVETLAAAGIPHGGVLPPGFEISVRENEGCEFTFIFNNDGEARDLRYGKETLRFKPFEVKVTRRPPTRSPCP
ncbi:MAG: beta-galactosidase [Clostridiales bacterium]|jgi:beta-galactosidase|nr:beta-galactosidase [Clostridiales bacterium]